MKKNIRGIALREKMVESERELNGDLSLKEKKF